MVFAQELAETLGGVVPGSMESFRDDISEDVIKEALNSVKAKPVRKRALPPDLVIWLVIGMALLRDRCIAAVASHLKLAAGGITSGGIVQARDRLGAQPMEEVFTYTAEQWALRSAEEHRWGELTLFALDGTCLRVADTPQNEAEFGRSRSGRSAAGYPQLRAVVLMAARSHLLYAANLGAYHTSETALARTLWQLLPDRSLVLIDRGFVDYVLFLQLMTSGTERHFMTRAKSNMSYEHVRSLGPGDELVRVSIHPDQRREDPSLPDCIVLRVVHYQRAGFKPQRLVSSLLDPEKYPADQIRELYHERWEVESGYDEIKTHTLEREEALRSRKPERVRQELWGLFVAYNLVRRQMERFANRQGISPLRVSYRASLLLVRSTCLCAATGVGSVKKLLDSMDEQMKLLILPPRRDRRAPREVKIKMSNYKRKTTPNRTLAPN